MYIHYCSYMQLSNVCPTLLSLTCCHICICVYMYIQYIYIYIHTYVRCLRHKDTEFNQSINLYSRTLKQRQQVRDKRVGTRHKDTECTYIIVLTCSCQMCVPPSCPSLVVIYVYVYICIYSIYTYIYIHMYAAYDTKTLNSINQSIFTLEP